MAWVRFDIMTWHGLGLVCPRTPVRQGVSANLGGEWVHPLQTIQGVPNHSRCTEPFEVYQPFEVYRTIRGARTCLGAFGVNIPPCHVMLCYDSVSCSVLYCTLFCCIMRFYAFFVYVM